MTSTQTNLKDISKQLNYVKQQEQLRAFGDLKNNSGLKPLNADTMIEDLLSKKETFQKYSIETQQKPLQMQDIPGWLSGSVPSLYCQVWSSVQSDNGLADTPLLSNLLMSSGLSTDTLAYIWSLANRTVPGALTQQEVYLVLALVALTQSGYQITSLAAVLQLPQGPLPKLDLTLLPPPRAHVYPNPLNVTTLPDQLAYNWVVPESQYPHSDKIGISYVSNGFMVNPRLLVEDANKTATINFTDFQGIGVEGKNTSLPNSSLNMSFESQHSHTKNVINNFTFSFPSVNESPSHIATSNSEETDPFDDEFTDFQSADFTSSNQPSNQMNTDDHDDDEFTNFQKAPPKFGDDLSVLVISGKSIPSAQALWVTDTPLPDKNHQLEKSKTMGIQHTNLLEDKKNISLLKSKDKSDQANHRGDKYDVFEEIDDDRFSVFHNPLPEEECKSNPAAENSVENVHLETKSIFNHSLFNDPEPVLDFFETNQQSSGLQSTKVNMDCCKLTNDLKGNIDDSDEFFDFQSFSASFPNPLNTASGEKGDKYDVFRIVDFKDKNVECNSGLGLNESKHENSAQDQYLETEMGSFHNVEKYQRIECDLFSNKLGKENDDTAFGEFQGSSVSSSTNDSNNIDNLFSSLNISDKTNEKDKTINLDANIGVVEDKYKALRLLEESSAEIDEFGEFLGADVPNCGNQPPKGAEKPSIQVKCLEACLNLLKDGISTLSRASSQDIVSEVLSDPRANTYLDCLLEVHKVSERIISNMNGASCDAIKAELHEVWEKLSPFMDQTSHNPLVESVGALCGVCCSNTGPSPVTFGAMTFHSPCANLFLHCVEPVLPNITYPPVLSS